MAGIRAPMAAFVALALAISGCSVSVTGTPARPSGWAASQESSTGPGSSTAPRTTSSEPVTTSPKDRSSTSPAQPSDTVPTSRDPFPTLTDGTDPSDGGVPDNAVGLRPEAPTPDLKIQGLTSSEADSIAAHTLADLFDYYESIFPTDFGLDYAPPRALVSYDSTKRNGEVCTIPTYDFPNAFYAPACDTVAWDRAVMLPEMLHDIGTLAPAVVLSHEIGHDVQDELNVPSDAPSIVLEQQADCYAGAYWRWVADGNSKHFLFNQTEGMRQLLLALFQAHDPVEDSTTAGGTDDDTAHGNGFDRTYAATLGYTSGASRCNQIDQHEIDVRGQEFPFTPSSTPYGNLDITSETLAGVMATVDEYFSQTAPGYVPPTLATFDGTSSSDCAGYRSSFPVAYCPTTNTVSYQLSELQRIGKPTAGWDSANGDFSAIVLLVTRYALAAQAAGKSRITGKNAGLRALCYAGTWATWMRNPHGGYSLSPTDLDKAIYEIVSSPIAGSDVNGETDADIIERVQAFDIGVTHLIPECFDFYPQ